MAVRARPRGRLGPAGGSLATWREGNGRATAEHEGLLRDAGAALGARQAGPDLLRHARWNAYAVPRQAGDAVGRKRQARPTDGFAAAADAPVPPRASRIGPGRGDARPARALISRGSPRCAG